MYVATTGPSICGDEDDVERGGIKEAARPPIAADGAYVGRVCRRGGPLDRARPSLHAQSRPPAPVVPMSPCARPPPRRATAPREPSATETLPASPVGKGQRRHIGLQTKLVCWCSVLEETYET
jgi:hypothetical protein